MFWSIVLLEGPAPWKAQLMYRLSNIFLEDVLINQGIHNSWYNYKFPRTWGSKVPPQHDAATSMLDCWYEVLFFKSCSWFTPNIVPSHMTEQFNFCLVWPQHVVPNIWMAYQHDLLQIVDEPGGVLHSVEASSRQPYHGIQLYSVFIVLLCDAHLHWPLISCPEILWRSLQVFQLLV